MRTPNMAIKFQIRVESRKPWGDLSGDEQHALGKEVRSRAEEMGFSTNRMWEPDREEHHVTRQITEMVWDLKKA